LCQGSLLTSPVVLTWSGGFQRKPRDCDCSSQIRKIRCSHFQTLETIENFAKFRLSAIRRYEELWGVEDRALSGRLKNVRAAAAIRTVRGADSPKSGLETEDYIPRAEYIYPVKLCFIRDDQHMGAHLRSKGHIVTPTLQEVRR